MWSTILFLTILVCPFFVTEVKTIFCYNAYTIIKFSSNGLVLDASTQDIQLKNFTQAPRQLWKLRHRCDGTYYIFNPRSGCGLDIQGGEVRGNNITVSYPHRNATYYWYINSDGSIVNAGSQKMAIDVVANDHIIAETKDGSDSQKFEFSCFCCTNCFMFRSACC